MKRLVLALAVMAPVGVWSIRWAIADNEAKNNVAYSLWVMLGFLAVALFLAELVGRSNSNDVRSRYGYLEVLIGKDGYASTSKAMVWLWTLVFASALVLLTAMSLFTDLSTDEAFGKDWNPYLLLLGGPFAASVLAKGITVGRAGTSTGTMGASQAASSGAMATAPPADDLPAASDLAKSNAGDTSLPDTQYVLFSLVAVVYFVAGLIDNLNSYATNPCPPGSSPDGCVATIALPNIPSALLGLTSLAALTYVGAKTVETHGIRVARINPNPVQPGQPVTISLANATEAATKATISVRFGERAEEVEPTEDPTKGGAVRSFAVSAPAEAGSYEVVVSTPDGETPPTSLDVRAATTPP
jgi:hypothetical protein